VGKKDRSAKTSLSDFYVGLSDCYVNVASAQQIAPNNADTQGQACQIAAVLRRHEELLLTNTIFVHSHPRAKMLQKAPKEAARETPHIQNYLGLGD